MNASMATELKAQINEALSRAKWKKACYFYDDFGFRRFVGVFSPKKTSELKRFLREKKLLNRFSEFDVETTEHDTSLDLNSKSDFLKLEKYKDAILRMRNTFHERCPELDTCFDFSPLPPEKKINLHGRGLKDDLERWEMLQRC